MSYTLKDYKAELKWSSDIEFDEPLSLPKSKVIAGQSTSYLGGSGAVGAVAQPLEFLSIFMPKKSKAKVVLEVYNDSGSEGINFNSINGSELLSYSGFAKHNKWQNLMNMELDFTDRADQSPVVRELCVLIDALLNRMFTPNNSNERLLLEDIVGYYFSKKQASFMQTVIKEGRFTLGTTHMLLINLRKAVKKNKDLQPIDMYMRHRVRSPLFLLNDDFKRLIQELEKIRDLRNELMHDGFKELSGQERIQVIKAWFGKKTFKRFYEKAPPADSPLIELLKERTCVFNSSS